MSLRPSINQIDKIMAGKPKTTRTSLRIPTEKWKEIKQYCLDNKCTMMETLLAGFDLMNTDAKASRHTDAKVKEKQNV